MEISSTGDNLNILIACDYLRHHNWMSFLCWYSLKKNLPDAKVYVASQRRIMEYNLFQWTRSCNVPLVLHKETNDEGQVDFVFKKYNLSNLLVVKPDQICIRDFNESGLKYDYSKSIKYADYEIVCDCKSDRSTVFASYTNGWGKFNPPLWINKQGCPLNPEYKFAQGEMTPNEIRIGKIWYSASAVFSIV
jgi:hypothetical protein